MEIKKAEDLYSEILKNVNSGDFNIKKFITTKIAKGHSNIKTQSKVLAFIKQTLPKIIKDYKSDKKSTKFFYGGVELSISGKCLCVTLKVGNETVDWFMSSFHVS